MYLDPVSALVIGGGMAAAQGGLSIAQASARNSALSRSAASANANARTELEQQNRVAGIQTTRARQNAARVRGLITVAAASRGVGAGGSVAALERNVDQDTALNQYAIDTNHYGAGQRVLAQLANVNQNLANEGQNPLLSGVTGALQGFSTGLSIAGGIKGIMGPEAPLPGYGELGGPMGPPDYLKG